MRKLLIAATAIFSLIGASAQAQVIKTVENERDVIYSRGHTPGSSIQLITNSGSRVIAILANNCGIIRVRANQATPTSININGTARSIASPVTLTGAPVCMDRSRHGTEERLAQREEIPMGIFTFLDTAQTKRQQWQ